MRTLLIFLTTILIICTSAFSLYQKQDANEHTMQLKTVMDKVDEELKFTRPKRGSKQLLSNELIKEIAILSKKCVSLPVNPNDKLSKKYNSGRAALLLALLNRKLNTVTLDKIYEYTTFSEASLENKNLKGCYLKGAILTNSNLKGVNLSHANLEGINLSYTDLDNANLENTNLNKAIMKKAYLKGAKLKNASLRNAYLVEANLTDINIETLELKNANLNYAIQEQQGGYLATVSIP